jgi:undecaprenyl pyrophosphate synthase
MSFVIKVIDYLHTLKSVEMFDFIDNNKKRGKCEVSQRLLSIFPSALEGEMTYEVAE